MTHTHDNETNTQAPTRRDPYTIALFIAAIFAIFVLAVAGASTIYQVATEAYP